MISRSLHRLFIKDRLYKLFIDSFAGGGGASTGIEEALGRPVDDAINHDGHALGMHRINHPLTVHHNNDVFDTDPDEISHGRPIGALWASPDCRHFSKAKGGRPVDKKIRGLALVIFRYAKARVERIFMENVEEIQTWGPLRKNNKPDKRHTGRTWRAFLDVLGPGVSPDHPDIPEMLEVLGDSITKSDLVRGFGYDVEYRELRACDYGAPTIRKRLILIARCDGKPIVWPEPTHFAPNDIRPGPRYRSIAECIDWTIPCRSIFLTRAQAKRYNCRRPLAKSTLRRIATGIDRFVLKSAKPFVIALTHQGSDRVEPSAHRGEKALVDASFIGRFTGDHPGSTDGAQRNKSPDAPLATQDTSNRFGLVAASLARDFSQSVGSPPDAPAPTVMPGGQGKTSLIQSTLAPIIADQANTSNNRTMPANEPMRTQCAQVKRGHFALTSAHMVQQGHKSSNSAMVKGADEPLRTQSTASEHSLVTAHLASINHPNSSPGSAIKPADEPMGCQTSKAERALITANLAINTTGHPGAAADTPSPTVCASGKHHVLVTGTLVGAGGPAYAGEPRPLDVPGGTVVTKECKALAAAHMVKLRGTSDSHIASSQQDAGAPLDTLSAGGQHHAVTAAFMAQANDGFNKTPGHPVTGPSSTISATGSQQQLVAANTVAYYGSETDGQALDESTRTISTKPRFGLTESQLAPGLTPEQIEGARQVAEFLRSFGVQFEGEFASITIDGVQLIIVDIGMRMLAPRELYRAQGFPEHYLIDHAVLVNPKTGEVHKVELTIAQQIKMCGNSVCPPLARAIVRANCPDMILTNPLSIQRELVV